MKKGCAVEETPQVTTSPRVPCNPHTYANTLAMCYRDRHQAGMPCEALFTQLLHHMDNLIYRQALRLQRVRRCPYENSYADITTRVFELVLEFDPERMRKDSKHRDNICFTTYLKLKLSSWVSWQMLKSSRTYTKHVHKELAKSMPNDELVSLSEELQGYNMPASYQEARLKLANYSEQTCDLLFLRHVMDFTQEELGDVLGISQWAVGLHLRDAHEHLAQSSLADDPEYFEKLEANK